MVLACDVSNYNNLEAVLAEHPDVGRVVVRCSLENQRLMDLARQQCQDVRDRGLGLDVYVWAYPRLEEADTLAVRAQGLVGDFAPDIYWIDCEDRANFYAEAALNIDWLHTAVQGFVDLGLRVGIYTGHWFWTDRWMANTTEFSDLPLWAATNTKTPDRSLGWEFGGWTHPFAGVQYDLSGPDLDCFDDALYQDGGGGDDSNLAEQWIDAMEALTGTPYVFGGKDVARDGGLDCSGLITSTARSVGLDLGDPDYTSADGLKQYCDAVETPERGTLVLFHSTYGTGGPDYATHVGVHLHDTVMIDTHDGVHETDYGSAYWQQHLLGFWHPQGLTGGGDDMTAEQTRIAKDEVLRTINEALAVPRLPKAARVALEHGARPATETIIRLGGGDPDSEEA